MNPKTLATTVFVATAACFSSACGAQQGSAAAQVTASEVVAACSPMKIALVLDKSKSAPGMRTPTITLEDIDGLVNVVATCGGELAVGVIHDQITTPFVRLRLEATPVKPQGSSAHNALTKRKEQAVINRTYNAKYEEWQRVAAARIAKFNEQIAPIVEREADANWSPVWDAVARGDLFLAERERGANVAAHRVLLIVGDATDDVKRHSSQYRAPLQALKGAASTLIVNGAGTVGSLAALGPEVVESFDAAIRAVEDIAATANGNVISRQ